jgi:hypothetical protein
MTIAAHASEFAGLPVKDFDPEIGIVDPTGTIYRLSVDYDAEEPFMVLLSRFFEDPKASQVPGLVIGAWQGDESDLSSESIVEALVAARESLTSLRSLFLGDIISEENEISWIQQSDVTPLFDAYPNLENFQVRGGSNLVIGTIRHQKLRSLVVETGGLDAEVVRGIGSSDLPRLEHLELWLGSEGYGANVTVADLGVILQGELFPSLVRLGICNCESADEFAKALATAPVLKRLDVLDMSMGNLGDEGALALAENPAVAGLDLLDIHFHYVSDESIRKLEELGIKVNADDRQEPDEYSGEVHRGVGIEDDARPEAVAGRDDRQSFERSHRRLPGCAREGRSTDFGGRLLP